MTNKVGRPTKYDDDYHPQAVLDYMASCKDSETVRISMESGKTESTAYQLGYDINLPTVHGLVGVLDVCEDTIYEWKKQHPKFSESIKKLLAEQASRLIHNGLSNKASSSITKLMLMTNHGYAEKLKGEHSVSVVNMDMDFGLSD